LSERLPPLRLLAVFETVMRSGGVKQAARALNVSQPAVSQALRQLESHVGTGLLDRSTRPAGLTDAGEILYRASADNLDRLRQAMDDISALAEQTDNSVTVACTIGFATYWLMPRLEAFYLQHPGTAVNVHTTQHEVPSLGPGGDIALRFGDGHWRDGEVRLLFQERIEPVCAPQIAERIATRDEGLASAYLIHVTFDDPRWLTWKDYLRQTGQAPVKSSKDLRFSNYVQATQAALSGHGVMLGWKSITGDLVAGGTLLPALDEPLNLKDSYHAVISHRARNPDAAHLVAQWLEEESAPLRAE
jgi:LysR family glycine cleavage system transcriptional activator